MKNHLYRSSLTVLFVLVAAVSGYSQKAKAPLIDERNVRAEMNFLAGDAMQGRGSGTMFERIAAEYIGSQFMQFGLEPAGEKAPDGKATFVQTVEVAGRETLSNIKFEINSAANAKIGRDFIVFSITSKAISGELQKLKIGDTAKAGSVVLLMLSPDDKFETFQAAVAKFQKDGAAAVLLAETKEIRENWDSVVDRKTSLSRRGGTMLAVANSLSDELGKLPDGTKISLNAEFAPGVVTYTWNAMGKITGTDPKLASEVILLTSHLDHLGVRENAPGADKIFNGADDDASGSVAVLELARILAAGKKPKRTVYFVCFGSEEAGGFGARHFVENMPFPKEKLVANLEFEMIGRPDAKVKPEELWLTGYERSNLGPELAKRGAKLVQDPHPEENFFMRSDNIQLARAGIIAHTVSSFGLHTDYHHASDEVKTIDFTHMTRSINSMIAPVQWLVNSNFIPTWVEGKKP
ncbi:MAG TPA: M20/M25/M40 family metallo-hydrolase [Pyrinomonadaceae bacterium]|nr:M20/M25/M40 family metallo-hydrolase [Pyrinomonadaceae bacterium]HQX56115.1 M20/M25/M40 family metallo-hydrolase [Pyrinomonadaceae bacterium]HQY68475.1 M20/M25/M40 family metallo-hydrolase [Pyrinomonadaceae bacterium]HRA40692.1 M20/M25/M40 family metallo-hydrolase [Pyrinomonadaceae bacterium]